MMTLEMRLNELEELGWERGKIEGKFEALNNMVVAVRGLILNSRKAN